MQDYFPALRTTLRQTAAAYGYTLTIASSSALLTSVRGTPSAWCLFLFAAGGLFGFAVLDFVLEFSRNAAAESPEAAFPFAGTLNFISVLCALGTADLVAHVFHTAIAWLLAPLLATVVYLALVAVQVALVGERPKRSEG